MSFFINYNTNTGFTIDTYRNPNCAFGEITDVVKAINNEDENVCCSLDGAKDALEDGSIWEDSDQTAIEALHTYITDFERTFL